MLSFIAGCLIGVIFCTAIVLIAKAVVDTQGRK